MKNKCIYYLGPLVGGTVFAIGLGVSGMLEPKKVIGFLNFFGDWNPALLFVMVGAISVHFVLFRVIIKRKSPLFDSQFHLPIKKQLDQKLIIGAILFGAGWGISGLCPGPGLASLVTGSKYVFVFVLTMVVGVVTARTLTQAIEKRN